MGAAGSHQHDPFDRTNFGSSFKRSVSLRHSKSKGSARASQRKMDKIRSSFRDSFRKKKEVTSDLSKQQQWQIDSADVRAGTCFFHVKYLGCLEVFESRGMQTCEEALNILKNTRRRPVKSILYVSGDGLRVVEDDTKGLIVDQTIEKVSFCAPDRNHERGFSYICRDGTTRRWLCHGFFAVNESGERLSHAVGCAFALCLERKQTREKENVNNTTETEKSSNKNSTSANTTAATVSTISAVAAAASIPAQIVASYGKNFQRQETLPARKPPVAEIHPIERPHATYSMLQRQGSFRGLSHLNQASPFKRQLSLKISDLPSNLERVRLRNLMQTTVETTVSTTTTTAFVDTTGTTGESSSTQKALIAKVDAVSLQAFDNALSCSQEFNRNDDSLLLNSSHNHSVEDLRNSLKRSASYTPPATPPPTNLNELPLPEQWLGKVSEITSNISELTANITELASNMSPSKSSSGVIKFPLLSVHGRAHSLGSGQNAYSAKKSDPFDAEWVSDVTSNVKNTNPFLTNITDAGAAS